MFEYHLIGIKTKDSGDARCHQKTYEYQLGMASNELTILYDCAMSQQLAIISDEELISGISVKSGYAEIDKTWRDKKIWDKIWIQHSKISLEQL